MSTQKSSPAGTSYLPQGDALIVKMFDGDIVPTELRGGTEPVKEFETKRQPFFCASFPIVGLLIHATVGNFGGDGRRWRNRAGLAA